MCNLITMGSDTTGELITILVTAFSTSFFTLVLTHFFLFFHAQFSHFFFFFACFKWEEGGCLQAKPCGKQRNNQKCNQSGLFPPSPSHGWKGAQPNRLEPISKTFEQHDHHQRDLMHRVATQREWLDEHRWTIMIKGRIRVPNNPLSIRLVRIQHRSWGTLLFFVSFLSFFQLLFCFFLSYAMDLATEKSPRKNKHKKIK